MLYAVKSAYLIQETEAADCKSVVHHLQVAVALNTIWTNHPCQKADMLPYLDIHWPDGFLLFETICQKDQSFPPILMKPAAVLLVFQCCVYTILRQHASLSNIIFIALDMYTVLYIVFLK